MLHVAAELGATDIVEMLLRLGASVEAVDAEGASALQRAILARSEAAASRLLAAGADATETFRGDDAIGAAIVVGSLPMVRAIVRRVGLDVRSAAALDEVAVLTTIIANDASLVRGGELTPLHIAARFGSLAAAKALVAAGADVEATVGEVQLDGRDVAGWTAARLAVWYGHAELALWLGEQSTRPHVGGISDHVDRDKPILGGHGSMGMGDTPELEELDDLPIPQEGRAPPSGSTSTFIGLGGGLLRDERHPDEELVPRSALASGRESSSYALEESLGACVAAGHWFEASRVAERYAAEAVALPEAVGGAGLDGQRLMMASALQTSGRVFIERHAYGDADVAFAAATQQLAPLALEAGQVLPVHRLWVALALGRSRLELRVGRAAEAEARLREVLPKVAGKALEPLRARLLGALAVVLGEAARYRDAIATAREALQGAPKATVPRQNLATLLARVGERNEAKAIIAGELARVMRREIVDAEDSASIRYAAGLWALLDGRDGGLIVDAREELALVMPDHPALGRFDLGLGLALIAAGRNEEALTALTRGASALLRSEGVASVEALSPQATIDYARTVAASATAQRQLGKLDVALESARAAYAMIVGTDTGGDGRPVERAAMGLEARWPIELELARIAAAQGHLATAIYFGKRATKTLTAIMDAGLPPELMRAFVDDRMAAWRELADHLSRAGRFVEATAALAAVRQEESDQFATRGNDADATRKQAMPDVGAEKHDERPLLAVRSAQRDADKVAETVRAGAPDAAVTERLEQARKVLRERRRAFEAWLQTLEGELEKMPPARAQAIAAMNLRDLASLQDTLGKLGPGVVMVHYLITADRVRAIVTTSDSQVGRESPIAQADLNALVFQFRQVLADPKRDARAAANALYRVLIEPIVDDLAAAKAETLLVSLDGTLRYAPLAALWDGQQWLVERYRVVHFARAALHNIMATRPNDESLAAFGCGRAVPGYQELTAVPAELESIVKRNAEDPDGELPGVVQLDDAFSLASFSSVLAAKRYSTVHIASHFVLGPGGESESYLLLGDGQRLTLEDIRYDMRFDGVDLLSLSACNTAVGDAGSDGREIEGFASLALRLGARAVLATLWPVSDASTGLFMRTLYRMIKADPQRSRAEVLRLAMLAFIRGEVHLDTNVAERGARPLTSPSAVTEPVAAATIDLAHPRYWAPFVFIGNWR